MSDPSLSDIDFKNKMGWVSTFLNQKNEDNYGGFIIRTIKNQYFITMHFHHKHFSSSFDGFDFLETFLLLSLMKIISV